MAKRTAPTTSATKTTKTPAKKAAPTAKATVKTKGKAQIVTSKLAYQGKVFSVYTETVREPNGVEAVRDVVRHSGSVVILAVDDTNPRNPLVVIERQFRHAADQYLLELPAGRV
ncbi:MAG: NUDIX hydrolase, partial [Terriglobus sp.]